jgi:hypothetical protein
VKLPVRLAPAGRRLLRQQGSLRIRVAVSFRSAGAPSSRVWKLTLTLKKRVASKRLATRIG